MKKDITFIESIIYISLLLIGFVGCQHLWATQVVIAQIVAIIGCVGIFILFVIIAIMNIKKIDKP